MARISFCGGSYQSESPNADCESSVNMYPESIESGVGQSAVALYYSPGLALFAGLPGMRKVLKTEFFFGRLFSIAEDLTNQYLWEVFPNIGTPSGFGEGGFGEGDYGGTGSPPLNLGTLGAAGGQCSMVANNAKQLLICSSGRVFLLLMATNVLTELDTTSGSILIGPVAQVSFSDGFFVALIANSQTIQVSALLNGTATGWSPLNFTIVSVFADNVLSMLVDHREVWLWGPKQTIPYFDAGSPIFPYLPVPGGFIEQGIIAPQSPIKLDNTVLWIGGDERGAGIAWRAQGYLPTRISNHALENEWQSYPTLTDAIGYSFQDRGHSFAHWYFPSANKSWRYDVATGLWHEPRYGDFAAHLSQCHVFAFGKHLVGDRTSGNIYDMSIDYLTDNGMPIQRVRRGPPVSSEQEFFFPQKFRVCMEGGLGPQPPLLDEEGNPRGPIMNFRQSIDGGHNWSDMIAQDCGQAGDFQTIIEWRRLGRARQWVGEISMSDPVPWKIMDAYLEAPGYEKQQRLPKRIAQQA